MDINKVWLSGLVVSQPIISKPNARTPTAVFNFQVNEQYIDGQGITKIRSNILRVEGLGKAAQGIMEKVQHGLRYYIDGYIRQDQHEDGESVKVRIFSVYKEDTGDGAIYLQALRQALDIMKRSRDIGTAIETLEGLVAAK